MINESLTYDIHYKIIFLDFNMPVMDGIEAATQIRATLNQHKIGEQHQPKIIGVTGHVQERFQQQGLEAGMDVILPKPLYADVLLE